MTRVFVWIIASVPLIVRGADLIVVSPVFEEAGMAAVTISNRHASPLTGLLVQATITEDGKRRAVISKYLDVYVNAFHDKSVGPGEQYRVPLISAEGARRGNSAITTSALFQDGARFGDPQGIDILIDRRKAVHDAIQEHRLSLEPLRGTALANVTARVSAMAEQQKKVAFGMRPEEIAKYSAGSQVTHWVKGAFDGAPPGCGIDCVGKRIEYVLRGLDVWGGQIQRGVAEHPRQ